jgi:uncharacterized protein YndB with AHSA1/START domain
MVCTKTRGYDASCTYTVTLKHMDQAGAQAHRDMGFFEGWGTAADQMAALAQAQPQP